MEFIIFFFIQSTYQVQHIAVFSYCGDDAKATCDEQEQTGGNQNVHAIVDNPQCRVNVDKLAEQLYIRDCFWYGLICRVLALSLYKTRTHQQALPFQRRQTSHWWWRSTPSDIALLNNTFHTLIPILHFSFNHNYDVSKPALSIVYVQPWVDERTEPLSPPGLKYFLYNNKIFNLFL